MAKLTKSRARKPLVEGGASVSGTGANGVYVYGFALTRYEDEDGIKKTHFDLTVDADEALRFVDLVAGMETHDAFANGYYNVDRRTPVEKLRALADKLDAAAAEAAKAEAWTNPERQ